MGLHTQWISEWAPVPAAWLEANNLWQWRDPRSTVMLLLVAALAAVLAGVAQRRFAAAAMIAGAAWLGTRHVRFQALFACIVVLAGGTLLSQAWARLRARAPHPSWRLPQAIAILLIASLALLRSFDLVSNRYYLSHTEIAQFGMGLSWWFPDGAAAFLERSAAPGEMFNTYDAGGFLAWRLGEKRRDYIDGRAIPFGPELFLREDALLHADPDSQEWQDEANRYGIRLMVVPLARFDGLQFVPRLPDLCASASWRPVYMDEVSAVFALRAPDTEAWIQRNQIDCATAALPAPAPARGGAWEFNRWANASAVLYVLRRNDEALAASEKAMAIFAGSPSLRFIRGRVLATLGRPGEAEREFRAATDLEASDATWSALAQFYQRTGRADDAARAWQQAARYSNVPHMAILSEAYVYLGSGRPEQALRTFDRAEREAPRQPGGSFALNLARGRAAAWSQMGNVSQAIPYAEQAARLAPGQPDVWMALARMYEQAQRPDDARMARQRAAALGADPAR